MGPEKLDNTVYFIRGLYDLADMASAKRDRATERWAGDLADKLRARFDPVWWDRAVPQYADSLSSATNQDPAEALDRRHPDGGRADRRRRDRARASRPPTTAATALAERETPCFSGELRSTGASSTRLRRRRRTGSASASSSR